MRKRIIVYLIILVVLITGIVVSVAVAKDSVHNYDWNGRGKIIMDSQTKTERTITINGNTVNLTYAETENRSNLNPDERLDKYGTYDIYIDAEGTEYYFLLDSDLFCGFIKPIVGIPMPENEAISLSEAVVSATNLLADLYDFPENYTYCSCEYNAIGGYYEIKYAYYSGELRTDDVIWIWVDATGVVTAFSDFNRERYSAVIVSNNQIQNARELLAVSAAAVAGDCEYSVVEEYVGSDIYGGASLVWGIEIRFSEGEVTVVRRELINQRLQ